MFKNCKQCGVQFEITEKDQGFYKLIDVPAPLLCYLCRMQRRLSYRNERYLYKRKCDLTGKEIISCFSPDKKFKIYDIDVWWSDKWDPLQYAKDFDFNRPFFEQFFELKADVPRLALQQQQPMFNSDYCNCASQNKNCYLIFASNRCEDCYYGSWINDCKNCVDNWAVFGCELCYDCVHCSKCYDLKYSQDCINCKSSYFLRDCIGCMSCFACSNLRNKQYYVFNKPKSKEEYGNFIKSVNPGSYKIVTEGKSEVFEILKDLIVKEYHGDNVENSSGDYIYDCKNTYLSFSCDNCEDVSYCFFVEKAKSSMDYCHWGVNAERIYECQSCGYNVFNLRFCNLCWSGCNDLTYCDHCFSCKNCFGCVGLKKKEYCIFNKQYSRQEYEEIVPRIIEHMRLTAEFGEWFPVKNSPFAYNESVVCYEKLPLTREEVLKKGWQWKEKDLREYKPQIYRIPDDIKDVDASIYNEILACEICGKNFKIIPQEFSFYQKSNIPVPRKCSDCRHFERLKLENPYILFDRNCQKCGKAIKTTYNSDRPEMVYCEDCYLKEIY